MNLGVQGAVGSQQGWGMTTSVIQQKGLPNDYVVHIKGIPLYHRSGEKARVIPQPWFTEFCNSQRLSRFAATFIGARAKISADSCVEPTRGSLLFFFFFVLSRGPSDSHAQPPG